MIIIELVTRFIDHESRNLLSAIVIITIWVTSLSLIGGTTRLPSVSSVSSFVRCDLGCFAQLRVAVAFPSFAKILKGGGRAVRLENPAPYVTRYTWLHLYSIYTMFFPWPLWYRYSLTNWGRFVGKSFTAMVPGSSIVFLFVTFCMGWNGLGWKFSATATSAYKCLKHTWKSVHSKTWNVILGSQGFPLFQYLPLAIINEGTKTGGDYTKTSVRFLHILTLL